MAKYSDINRGPELKEAYEKMKLWREKSREQKALAYKEVAKPSNQRVKVDRTTGYLLAFSHNKTNLFYEVKVLSDTQGAGTGSGTANIARGLVDTYFKTDPPAGATDVTVGPPRGFKPAKIILSERTQTETTTSNSRMTNIPYLRHRTNNVSCAFGRVDADDTYTSVTAAIKAAAAYDTFDKGNDGKNRIGFTPEQV
jgi:hypothetical protein